MLKVLVFCWNCGGKIDSLFSKCTPYNKNMGEATCPYCDVKQYALWKDLVELENRQTKRGVPRL